MGPHQYAIEMRQLIPNRKYIGTEYSTDQTDASGSYSTSLETRGPSRCQVKVTDSHSRKGGMGLHQEPSTCLRQSGANPLPWFCSGTHEPTGSESL